MQQIRDFFSALDAAWDLETNPITLPLFGCGALLLRTNYDRLTKDSDVFETLEHTPTVRRRLLELAGKGTALHLRHHLYLEVIASGIPFLPHEPLWHPYDLELESFHLTVLDVVDVVVSKLARFDATDRADIDAMIHRKLVDHARFAERFREAVDERSGAASADQLPKYVERFHTVERDMFGKETETEIELPSWI